MKTIKIFAFPSHASKDRTSGVDFARIIQPMKYLNGLEYEGYKFDIHTYDPAADTTLDWISVAKKYDAVYLNYTLNAWAFSIMGAMMRKEGKPMILDLDDNLWNVQPDNSSYHAYRKGAEGIKNFTAICNEVDHITCTNNYLKNVIVHNTRRRHNEITVFDNYIDLDMYGHRCEFRDKLDIQLLHFGSTTHFNDLQNSEFIEGIDRVMKRYPNVTFKTVGAMIGAFRYKWGPRYINSYGAVDVYKWITEKFPVFMDEADICVVPLEDNIYTRCKSAIKYLEMSSAKKPGVYQDIRQYNDVIDDGHNGFLAYRADHWFEKISRLVEDSQLRKDMGEKAFQTVESQYRIQDAVKNYARFFVDYLTKK